MKYTIELTEQQARLLSAACDFTSRFICGQVDTGSWPADALHGKAQERFLGNVSGWCEMRDEIDGLMRRVKELGWQQGHGAHYGVGYNDNADILTDIHHVIRHRLWQDLEGPKSSMTTDAFPAHRFGKEPLAVINKRRR